VIGPVQAKKELATALLDYFAPMRAKRAELAQDPAYVDNVLRQGAARANEVAATTMSKVREAVGLR
jgi:tryptophanyl-tRNA synthetase